jgi:hypothetical protein
MPRSARADFYSSVEFLEHIRRSMPEGFILGDWFDPPNMLAKQSFVQHGHFKELVTVGYFELKMASREMQAKIVWDKITDAIRKIKEWEGASCPVR